MVRLGPMRFPKPFAVFVMPFVLVQLKSNDKTIGFKY